MTKKNEKKKSFDKSICLCFYNPLENSSIPSTCRYQSRGSRNKSKTKNNFFQVDTAVSQLL